MADMVRRAVEPEILDGLPASDPQAMASRRDLAWINALMFQPSIMAGLMRRHLEKPPRHMLEIGAGDGRFMLAVARRMSRQWQNVELTMLDRLDLSRPGLADAFAGLGWHCRIVHGDVFAWLEQNGERRFDLVCANLFLHHFSDADLVRLFTRLRIVAPRLLATEPLRSKLPHMATGLLRLIGANQVTMHDSAASVRAGFRDGELSGAWLRAGGLAREERPRGPFTQVFAGATDDI